MKKIILGILIVLFSGSLVYAATRSVVPRGDNEGGLGSNSKNWGDSYIDTLYIDGRLLASNIIVSTAGTASSPIVDVQRIDNSQGVLNFYDTTTGNKTLAELAAGATGAPTDADYLVGTANGSLSAEIVVGTTPGGELGNTWASPTIDDSITVDGWALGNSTATTINKLTLTPPATGSTLTLVDGKTLTVTNTVNLNTMTDENLCNYEATGTQINCDLAVNAGTDLTADLEEEVTEGSLADSTIISADIKDGTIAIADMSSANISQWTNNSGYLTSEVDTLYSVVSRGSVAGANITASGIVVDNTASSIVVDTNRVENSDGQLTFYDTTSGVKTLAELATGGAGGAPTTIDYLVGTASGDLSAEIVVGTTPGGSLGGTWASPTIDDLFLKNDANDATTGSLTATDFITSAGTASSVVVDTQYIEYSTGGAVTVRDGLTVNGNIIEQNAYYQYTLLPESSVLDDGAPPAITVIESSGTGTSRKRIVSFDSSTDEIIYYTFVVPDDMASGNWLVDVYWYANSTTATDDAIWGVAISATTPADADTLLEDAVSTIDYAAGSVDTNEANRLLNTTITLSDLDSVAASDIVTLAFRRDADNTKGDAGGDGLAVDANVIAIRIRIPRS